MSPSGRKPAMSSPNLGEKQAPDNQGRSAGGTERSWCKAVPGGTGTTALAFLLSPPPPDSSILSALHRLQQHSPLLRSTLSRHDLTFHVSPVPTLRLLRHSLPDTETTLHSILLRELNLHDDNDEALLHATLYPLPPSSDVLVLRIHSAIADRTSSSAIARQLAALLVDGNSPGDHRNVEPLLECLEDLIPSQHRKKPFWARGKDMAGYSLNLARSSHLHFADARARRSTDLVMLDLTLPESRRLLALCEDRGVALCGVLTAAVLLAAVSSKSQPGGKAETYSAITLVDCRDSLSRAIGESDVGFYHSAVQTVHSVRAGEGLWDVAARYYGSLSAALGSRKHMTDVDDLNFLMARAIQAPQLTPASSLRTALVSVFDKPAVYDSAELFREGASPVKEYLGCSSVHGVGPSVAIFDSIWDGRLSCACLYPSPLHSREQMLELVRSMKAQILAAIAPSLISE